MIHQGISGGRGARALLLASTLALALAACGDKKGEGGGPKGQVVARLDGTDITLLEVNAELAGAQIPPNVSRREAEQAALQNIITRRQLMKVASERKLDQNPQFKLQERRLSEQLLVQALARDIAAKVPEVTREDTDKFIAENPQMFAERTIYAVDQIAFPRPPELEKLPLADAKTMEAVEAVLNAAGIQFRRQPGQLDTLGANPSFVKEITGLLAKNPDELFMFPAPVQGGQVMLVNRVTDRRVVPFTGERARTAAQQMLRNQRIQEALAAEVKKQQEAAKAAVTYQEGFAPPTKTAAPDEALSQAAGGAPDLPKPELKAPEAPVPAPAGQ
jgi:EpsD family peptidyl-prolyl cis-trans isomerase